MTLGAPSLPRSAIHSGRLLALWAFNLCLLVFFLFPFYWLTTTAFKTPQEVEAYPVRWWPGHLYWGNVRAVFTALHFQSYLLNSAIVAGTTTIAALSLATAAAYALAQLPLPAKRPLLVLAVLMVSIPGIALVPSLYLLLRELGWLNTRRALIAPYVASALPLAIWILTNAFRTIPAELLHQAEVDGCTPLQALRRVALPLAAPALLAAGVLTFLGAWTEFLFAALFILDVHSDVETAPVALAGADGSWGLDAAACEVVVLPVIAVVLLLQGRIIRGLTAGALKG
jgi:multiple sugar transport system permease protein